MNKKFETVQKNKIEIFGHVWDRCLSSKEIIEIYNSGKSSIKPTPTAIKLRMYWKGIELGGKPFGDWFKFLLIESNNK